MVDVAGPACSDWARSQHLDPVGTAGHYQGFLLVEQHLPWPADISDIPELADVSRLAARAGARLQAIFPSLWPAESRHPGSAPGTGDGAGRGGERRIIYYRSSRPGWAAPLVRSEARAGVADLADAAAGLLRASPGGGGAQPTDGGGEAGDAGEVVDVLVCTHGRRDACCGARGTELFGELLEALAPGGPGPGGAGAVTSKMPPPVRFWRTSHTGGHRFAPTAIVLPAATMWAWADVGLIAQVVSGDMALSEVLPRYRGCATLGPPHHQALERAVLAAAGPSLLATARRSADGPDGLVRLGTEGFGDWEAAVTPGRRVPQPECHTPPEQASKYGVEWVVEDLRQVVPA